MNQIQISHTDIFGDVDKMFNWLLEMHLPAKMRLVTAAQTKIQMATDVLNVAVTSVESRLPGQVPGVTFYYPPRAPEGAALQMRFYLNAAYESKCIEYRVPPRSHRVMAVLLAWWFLNTAYAGIIFSDPRDLYQQDNWPSYPDAEENDRIRSVVQLLSAYINGENKKEAA